MGGLTGTGGAGGDAGGAVSACPSGEPNPNGYCWRSARIGGGGFVSGIITSRAEPNLIYARTDVGGAYRWHEPSQAWRPLLDWVSEEEVGFLGVESLALDAREPSRLYMLVGIRYFNGGKTAILRSTDYGETFSVQDVTAQFTAHGNGMGRQSGERLAVDPNDGRVLFAGTRTNGLFESSDYGVTWERVTGLDVTSTPNDNGIPFVIFDPASGVPGEPSRTLYVGVSRAGEDNIFVSTDAGASFAPIPEQPTAFVPQRAALASDGTLYVTYGNGAGPHPSDVDPMDAGALFKLDTASGVWTDITPLRDASNRAFGGISIDPVDPARLVATTINTYQQQPWGYGDRIFTSDDAGATWVDLIAAGRVQMDTGGFPWIENNAIHWAGSIEVDPFDPERAFVTSGNGIFMTSELRAATSTWRFTVDGLEETVPLDALSVPGVPLITALGDYDGFIHTDLALSPATGRHAPNIGTTQSIAVAALDPARLARVGNALYLSRDGGQSWAEAARPTEDTGGSLAFSADGDVLLWSAASGAQRTTDDGQTWSLVLGLGGGAMPVADSVNASKFYAYDAESGSFLASSDGGQSFTPASALPGGGARRIRVLPGVEGEIWVALNAGGLSRSRDSGASFEPIEGVQSCRAIGFGAPAPGQSSPAAYIWGAAGGGPRGSYRSIDGGQSWTRINDDLHEYGGPGNGEFIFGDVNVFGRVFMSSAGRGLIVGEPARAE